MPAKARNTPAVPLGEALELLDRMRREAGFGPMDRETMAHALGHSSLSGSANRRVAALNHFGLVERQKGGAYRISDLGKSLLMPVDAKERASALHQAVKEPTFYQELWERYSGQPLPGMLPNILSREFGVHPNSGEEVAQIFRSSAEYAGLLENGVLLDEPRERSERSQEPEREGQTEKKEAPPTARLPSPQDGIPPLPVEEGQTFPVAVDATGRIARVWLPVPFTKRDLDSIGRWLGYMKSMAEETPDTSGN